MQLLLGLFLLASTAAAIAQQYGPSSTPPGLPNGLLWASPDAPTNAQTATVTPDGSAGLPDAPSHVAHQAVIQASTPSPQGNSAVTLNSHGATPSVPLASKRYLNFATSTSGGSGSLIFAGSNALSDVDTPRGGSASGANCGRSSGDNSNGSDWINSLLALSSHKGGRYCALGEGGFWRRGTYAATRAFMAHRYDGAGSFNASELLGPGIASAMPGRYYAYPNYAGQRLAARYASAVGRDTLKNVFSEFWPDFATHVLRRRP